MSDPVKLRKQLVHLAGMTDRRLRIFLLMRTVEMERAFNAFGDQLSVYTWGSAAELYKKHHVKVPRSLRRYCGATIPVSLNKTGRRRKNRRKHNRRWMPERDCECE